MVRQSKVTKKPKRKALNPLSTNVIPKKQRQIGDFFSAVSDEKPSLIIADDEDHCEHESDDYEDEYESSDEEEDDDDDSNDGEDSDDQDDDNELIVDNEASAARTMRDGKCL